MKLEYSRRFGIMSVAEAAASNKRGLDKRPQVLRCLPGSPCCDSAAITGRIAASVVACPASTATLRLLQCPHSMAQHCGEQSAEQVASQGCCSTQVDGGQCKKKNPYAAVTCKAGGLSCQRKSQWYPR